jgi:hypothetical protein
MIGAMFDEEVTDSQVDQEIVARFPEAADPTSPLFREARALFVERVRRQGFSKDDPATLLESLADAAQILRERD